MLSMDRQVYPYRGNILRVFYFFKYYSIPSYCHTVYRRITHTHMHVLKMLLEIARPHNIPHESYHMSHTT